MCFCLWYKTYNAIEGAESWDNYDDGYDDFGHAENDNYNSDNDPPTTTQLTLSIVRLDEEIQISNNSSERDDPSMIIANLVNETFAELSCISPEEARAYHHNHLQRQNCYRDDDKTTSQQQQSHCDTMKNSILQYHINTDKWVGFTSTLLKSLAYHRSIIDHRYDKLVRHDNQNDIVQQSQQQQSYSALPIVDLPRTKYNRPYLPRVTYNSSMSNNASSSSLYHNNNNNSSSRGGVDENFNSCMNITHQYPFICMIQQQQRQHQQQRRRKNQSIANNDKTPSSQLVVGVDVVTFHINLNTYTPTVRDFLNSLLHCFTTWEWNRIINTTTKKQQRNSATTTTTTNNDNSHQQQQRQQQRSDTSSIYEFYLRWAMKEAYTKALGLGMEINFNEVEIRLFGIDIDVAAAAAVSYCATTTTADIEREDDDSDDGVEEEGIWTTIQQHVRTTCSSSSSSSGNQQQFSAIGKVKRTQCDTSIQVMSSTLSTWEVWEFIFVPLYNSTTTDVVDDGTDDDEDSIDSVPDFLRYIDDNKNDDEEDTSDNDEDVTTNNITNDCNGEDESLVDLLSLDTTGLTPTENTTTAAAATTTMVGMEACTCICRGPLPANTTSYGINPTATAANLEYLTLTELIQLHRMGGGYNPRTQQAQTMNRESSTLFVNETETEVMYDTTTTTTNTNNLSTMEQMSNMLGFGRQSVMNDALDQHDDDSRDIQSNLSTTKQAVGVVVDGILSNMSSMTNAVMERGSKLTTLAEKTQTLEAASLDFAIMAKELNQRQNSWW